jgi:hypothetical protein
MNKHDLMKEHLLKNSQNGYTTTAKTVEELLNVEEPIQEELTLEEKITELNKEPMLMAYIKSEYPKEPSERMSYNEFVKLVNKCERETI